MLSLRSGSLHVQGIDLVVPDQETPRADKLAIAGLFPGTELTMTDCTLTLAANRPGAALFVVQAQIAAQALNRPTERLAPARSSGSATLCCAPVARGPRSQRDARSTSN